MNHSFSLPINRRGLLASAAGAASAGALAVSEALAQENNPAAQVADRGSSIKLTRLTATPVGPKKVVTAADCRLSLRESTYFRGAKGDNELSQLTIVRETSIR